jgi:ketosteroid isomerase-like protein
MSIVRDFEKAFNHQDVDGLLACFTPGATYVDMFYGPHTGPPCARCSSGCFARGATTGG